MTRSDAQIYDEVKDDLVRYATALVGPHDAADVVSAVIVRVLAKRPLASLAEPRPYLFRAVLNEAATIRRRTVRAVPLEPIAAVDEPNLRPEVLSAVMDLPVQQRAATFLFYWAGHTVAETALLMDIGEGTAKRYLSLARNTLKGVLHARA